MTSAPQIATGSTASAGRRTLRVALVGCGAIAQQMHLPVLAGHERLKLAALVDANLERARTLAAEYGVGTAVADAAALDGEQIDAAVVATPPFHHAPCAIELMGRGMHVLVEKPMATRLADAERMVAQSHESGVVLSVGLSRRLYPVVSLVGSLLASGYLGRARSFVLESGAVYGWPAATLGNMRRELAGGGVLLDMGPHLIDQLLAIFGGPAEVLEYRDNSLGGIESDCELTLRMEHRGEAIDGRIALSRTHSLGNTLKIECEGGELELAVNERYRVTVRPRSLELVDPERGQARPCLLSAAWADEKESEWYETFRAQVDDWVEAIFAGKSPRLSGESALPSMRLIDACYQKRTALAEPWSAHPLMQGGAGAGTKRRVLVTGASGFIGGRVAEILSQRGGYEVRALVHNPANASRVARLPVELVQADLGDAAALDAAAAGCDAVVHCAIGTAYGDRREIFRVTVEGTRQLVAAAGRAVRGGLFT